MSEVVTCYEMCGQCGVSLCELCNEYYYPPSGVEHVCATSATCEWHPEDGGDVWLSACGVVYTFIDGGPVENEHTFCIKCGKRVAVSEGET